MDEEMPVLERYVSIMCDCTSTCMNVNDARRHLFTRKGRDIEAIPPPQMCYVDMQIGPRTRLATAGAIPWCPLLHLRVQSRGITNVQILDLPSEELDHLLGKFFKDLRKINGKEYEPSTLTGLQKSIQRFLPGSKMNILKDDEFAFSQKVLEAKRKNLVVQGKGNRPNVTRSLTKEEKLFQSGAFSAEKPVAL
ncbi:uncharacterized protein KIAA1958-like [Acropora muricata]|uniref:uncharacterized protein KIAA1958-like n=1 Tax=Acropora muricata TaxID=159855 RepID=UPI0034E48F48